MNGGSGLSRRAVLKRITLVAVAFAASFGMVIAATSMVSPWSTVIQEFDVVLVEEGCQFSEIAAVCLQGTHGPNERPSAVAVPMTMEGEFSIRTCSDVRSSLMTTGNFWTRVSVWALPQAEWCQRLADDGREWHLANSDQERWPTFVHDGKLVGVGLLSEHFETVGEPKVGVRLDECVDTFMKMKSDAGRM